MIASSDDIGKSMRHFKSWTAQELLKLLQQRNIKTILDQLDFYKKAHKKTAEFQIWQEGIKPKLIQKDIVMRQKIDYIHQNPVKRGYVDRSSHWRHSSARDYDDEIDGLIEIEKFW